MGRLISTVTAAVLLLAAGCGNDPEAATRDVSASAAPTSGRQSAAGGTQMTAGSCVEQYSIETLSNRDFAFDGVVREIQPDPADGPDSVAFEVTTWFKGGTGDTAAKKAYGFGGGMTTAGGASHTVGDRLLVAGDEDFLWECGFTQSYDAEVAADWEAAL